MELIEKVVFLFGLKVHGSTYFFKTRPAYTLTHHLMDQIPQIMGQMTENAHKAMQDLIKDYVEDRIPSEHRVVIGDPAENIVELAEKEKADLIVMSTHGRSGIKGLFFGSVAEKVVRSAACPVLTMRYKEKS